MERSRQICFKPLGRGSVRVAGWSDLADVSAVSDAVVILGWGRRAITEQVCFIIGVIGEVSILDGAFMCRGRISKG